MVESSLCWWVKPGKVGSRSTKELFGIAASGGSIFKYLSIILLETMTDDR